MKRHKKPPEKTYCVWCHKEGATESHKDISGQSKYFHPNCFSKVSRIIDEIVMKIGAPNVGQCGAVRVEKGIKPGLCRLKRGHHGEHEFDEAMLSWLKKVSSAIPPTTIPAGMMRILRQRRDLSQDDASQDDSIKAMSPRSIVEQCVAWELGDPSWAGVIARWMNAVGASPKDWLSKGG